MKNSMILSTRHNLILVCDVLVTGTDTHGQLDRTGKEIM